MIEKLASIRNVGKFYSHSSRNSDLNWSKNTVLFAPNASGKSTIADILLSLSTGDTNPIRAKKTIGQSGDQQITVVVEGKDIVCDGSAWKSTYPFISLFDRHFIDTNVFESEVTLENRKHFFSIVVGDRGRELEKEFFKYRDEAKEQGKLLKDVEAKFMQQDSGCTVKEFVNTTKAQALQSSTEFAKIISTTKAILDPSKLAQLKEPSILDFQKRSVEQTKTLLNTTSHSLRTDAQRIVEEHIGMHLRSKETAIPFLKAGLDQMVSMCPFCSQSLDAVRALIDSYENVFNIERSNFLKDLDQERDKILSWKFGEEVKGMIGYINANNERVRAWKEFIPHIEHKEIEPELDTISEKLDAEAEFLVQELISKSSLTENSCDLGRLSNFEKSLSSFYNAIDSYNDSVTAICNRISKFRNELKLVVVADLIKSQKRQQMLSKRWSAEWSSWADNYEKAKCKCNDLENLRDHSKVNLKNYMRDIFARYEKRINEVLVECNADFKIGSFTGKVDGKTSGGYTEWCVVLEETRIPLTANSVETPRFRNVLSDGDKSALAFAFFVASMEYKDDLAQRVVIFDDPLSSLDSNRRLSTLFILLGLSKKVKQLCIFTHLDEFADIAHRELTPCSILQIRSDRKNGSKIEVFDITEYRKSEHAKRIERMSRYVSEECGTPSEIAGEIRLVFETVVKTKYYLILRDLILQNKGLGELLQMLKDFGLVDGDVLHEIMPLCRVMNDPHHGKIVDSPQESLNRFDVITMIQKTNIFLSKV